MSWTEADYASVAERVFTAWQWRRNEEVTLRPKLEPWHRLTASTDGESIFAGSGDCLVTRLSGGHITLVSAKRYRRTVDAWGILPALTVQIAASAIDWRSVRTPELSGRVDAERLEAWWIAESEWNLGGERFVAGRYAQLGRAAVDWWLAGQDWYFYDRFRYVSVALGAVWVMGDCVLTRNAAGDVILSELKFRKPSERHRVREAIRAALDELRYPYVRVQPRRSGALTVLSDMTDAVVIARSGPALAIVR